MKNNNKKKELVIPELLFIRAAHSLGKLFFLLNIYVRTSRVNHLNVGENFRYTPLNGAAIIWPTIFLNGWCGGAIVLSQRFYGRPLD